MKRLNKLFAIGLLTVVCCANTAFAAPLPQKNDPDDVVVTESSKTEKASEKATSKATSKASEKSSEKATSKTTAKASEKASSKATTKASEKATSKATEKSSEKSSSSKTSSTKSTSSPSESEKSDKIVLDPEESDDDVLVVTTPEPSLNVQNNAAQLENSKYLSKGAFAFWFIFGLLLGTVISFAVSYRFYMMSKRDSHVISELRALKRDIDSKMISTVGGFAEYDVQMNNSNPSYASPKKPIRAELDEETDEKSEEIYRKWETQIQRMKEPEREEIPQARRVERPVALTSETRGTQQSVRRRPVKKKSGVTDKIKGVISDMFPFDK